MNIFMIGWIDVNDDGMRGSRHFQHELNLAASPLLNFSNYWVVLMEQLDNWLSFSMLFWSVRLLVGSLYFPFRSLGIHPSLGFGVEGS